MKVGATGNAHHVFGPSPRLHAEPAGGALGVEVGSGGKGSLTAYCACINAGASRNPPSTTAFLKKFEDIFPPATFLRSGFDQAILTAEVGAVNARAQATRHSPKKAFMLDFINL